MMNTKIIDRISGLHNKIWKNKVIVISIIGGLSGVFFAFWVYFEWQKSAFWSGIFSNITTAFAVSFLTLLVTFNAKTESEEIIEKLQQSINDNNINNDTITKSIKDFNITVNCFKERRCAYCTNSLIDVKQNRKECDLEFFFSNAKGNIDIYTINLRSFVPYIHIIQDAAKRGVRVRIMAMHPSFANQFNALRIIDGDDPCNRWRDMKYTLLEFLNVANRTDNIDVKVYTDVAPTCVLIRADNRCYASYLINRKHSSETVHLLFEAKEDTSSTPFSYFVNHIESIWIANGSYCPEVQEIEECNYQ